nr:histone-lysine N-methyltransferase, H3 lysine-9 specific SUVH4-like isoform X3 [Tanacetum cinerariifolium]
CIAAQCYHGSYVYINPEIHESAIMAAEFVTRNEANPVLNIDYEKYDDKNIKKRRNRLIEAKDVVFECGPNCGCEPGRINRISQRKIKYQLERRLGVASGSESGSVVDSELEAADESDPEFCIDAGSIGNVARFINHSCDLNLFVQCVVRSHHDIKLARIVLVAAENIPPKQELTYDYGYALDSVVDENGVVKTLTCQCGTSKCCGRLY